MEANRSIFDSGGLEQPGKPGARSGGLDTIGRVLTRGCWKCVLPVFFDGGEPDLVFKISS